MKKCVLFIFALFFGCSVLAFDSSINLSDDINVLYYDSDSIKIKLDDKIKNSNYMIYYQYIPANEDEVLNFENENNEAYENLVACLDSSSHDKCVSEYNVAKEKTSALVPSFSSKWDKMDGDGSSVYSIPKFYDNYFLWIKAVDQNGNDIYSLFYESSSLNDDLLLSGVKTSVGTVSNINDVVAFASIMFSIGGIICFVLSIIFIIRYSHFRFRFNF